ncbi:MAG: hypothetical protein Q4F21_06670 [Lachnospiraceae bacterium]|nr:hypothetical protein [Lachnospiraceae bacterium]
MNIKYEIKKQLNSMALSMLDNCHDKTAHIFFKCLAICFPDERTLCNYATFLYKCCWNYDFSKKSMMKVFKLYRKSIKIYSDTNANIMLGDLYWECDDYKHAEKCYQRAIRCGLDEDSGYILWNLGVTQIYLQYYEKAYYTLRKFLNEYRWLIEKDSFYEIFYCVILYCLYRIEKNEKWKKRIDLNYTEFKEHVTNVTDPMVLIVYYMMNNYETICNNKEFLIEDSWHISKNIFLLVVSSLLAQEKIEEANIFYKYCKKNECEWAQVYDKCYFKLLISKDMTLLKDEIITNYIRDDILNNGIITSSLFYKSLHVKLPI